MRRFPCRPRSFPPTVRVCTSSFIRATTKSFIAMSLDDSAVNDTDKNLAGFAIWRAYDGKPETDSAQPQLRALRHSGAEWTDSDKAPFQKFRWVEVPENGFDAPITYRVRALYFTGQGFATEGRARGHASRCEPVKQLHTKFRPAFTRGYIASQAYTDKFKNEDIRPAGPKKRRLRHQAIRGRNTRGSAPTRAWHCSTSLPDCEKDTDRQGECLCLRSRRARRHRGDLPNGQAGPACAPFSTMRRCIRSRRKSGTMPIEIDAAKMIIAAAGSGQRQPGPFQRAISTTRFSSNATRRQARRRVHLRLDEFLRARHLRAGEQRRRGRRSQRRRHVRQGFRRCV